jgi:hypothetical protein
MAKLANMQTPPANRYCLCLEVEATGGSWSNFTLQSVLETLGFGNSNLAQNASGN